MDKVDRKIKVNSFLAAAVIAESNICSFVATFVNIPMISVILMALIFVSIILINGKRINVTSNSIVAFILFALLLFVSILLNGADVVTERFLYFLTFGMTALLAVSVKNNVGYILKYILLIGTANLIVYYLFRRNTFLNSEDFWQIQMGMAYGFVPPVIVCAVFIVYRKSLELRGILSSYKLFQIAFFAFLLLASIYVILIDCATRGVLIVAIFGISLILLRKLPHGKFIFPIIGVTALLFLFYLNWDAFFNSIIDNFAGGEVKSLAKMSRMAEVGDMSNGREGHYNVAYGMIMDRPLLGYGVGYFENVTRASYVHQLFLELLLECGIVGLILFMIPIVKFVRITFKEGDEIKYSFYIFILSCCFMPLLFSASFWLYPPFWYGYFYVLNTYEKKRVLTRIANN